MLLNTAIIEKAFSIHFVFLPSEELIIAWQKMAKMLISIYVSNKYKRNHR